MTISELKAFIEGLEVGGVPEAEQAKLIKDKIADLQDVVRAIGYPMPDTLRQPKYVPPYTTCGTTGNLSVVSEGWDSLVAMSEGYGGGIA